MGKAVVLAVTLAGIVATVAFARDTAASAVSPRSILIGGTSALAGESSALARGAAAYFRYVNSQGGVFGRTIAYRYLDDGSDPARTLQAVRRLVEQDGAFAIFNTPGTANNLAIRAYLNERKVPQLFVASGFSGFGREARAYPWTIGFGPTYRAEGTVYGRYLAASSPDARIAVLYQDDADGRELLSGLRRGLGTRAGNIAAAIAYDPSQPNVDAEVTALRQTRARNFAVFAFGKFARQALVVAGRLRWRPQVLVPSAVAAGAVTGHAGAGSISIAFAKDPADPAWAKDPGMKIFRKVMAAAGLGDLKDASYATGMASAFALVNTLKIAGRDLTRQTMLKATANLNTANNPFLLPGIVLKTGPSDRFPVEQMQLRRWSGARWVRFGGLIAQKS